MKVTLNTKQHFCGIYQSELLTPSQHILSNKVTDALTYTDIYQQASDNDIDICFIRPKNGELLHVVYTDRSGMIYRKGTKKVETISKSEKNPIKLANNINNVLKKILAGKYKAPEYDLSKIIQETIEKKPDSFVEIEDIIMDNPSERELLEWNEELERIHS